MDTSTWDYLKMAACKAQHRGHWLELQKPIQWLWHCRYCRTPYEILENNSDEGFPLCWAQGGHDLKNFSVVWTQDELKKWKEADHRAALSFDGGEQGAT